MIDFASSRSGAEPQTTACARLLSAVVWQAIVDACADTHRSERKANANLQRDAKEAVAFLFGAASVFPVYATLLGSNADAIRAALLVDGQGSDPATYRGVTGQNRRTLRQRVHWLTMAQGLLQPPTPTPPRPTAPPTAPQPAPNPWRKPACTATMTPTLPASPSSPLIAAGSR